MRNLGFVIVSLLTWASVAAADDPPSNVVTSTSQMPPDQNRPEIRTSQPSDLPAADTVRWVNRPLLITSSVLLVATYVPAAVIGYTSDRPSDQNNLYYPVVGPWMDLANRNCDTRPCGRDGVAKALLVLDGIGQGLGALGVITSFFLPDKVTHNWYLIGNNNVHVAPTHVGATGYGIGAAGVF